MAEADPQTVLRQSKATAFADARTIKLPSRTEAIWFRLRAQRHILLRGWRNLADPGLKRIGKAAALCDAPILAEITSPLWEDGNQAEFPLIAGKVENLRRAVGAFDGVEVRAGHVLSFWKQLGKPTKNRGFVIGREVREGCVVPTIAGGLCQISNGLAGAATRAGITLVERHGHTARITKGSDQYDDATIFWNYLDLRLQADFPFRIEAELTAKELDIRIRGYGTQKPDALNTKLIAPITPARGCLTCNQIQCFRNGKHDNLPMTGRTALLLNAYTPEFAAYLTREKVEGDWFAPWMRTAQGSGREWVGAKKSTMLGIARTLLKRLNTKAGKRQAAIIKADHWLANAYARQLRPHHTHLIIDQSLLAHFAQMGVLRGRHYTVLAHVLPAQEIQRRLDLAFQATPNAASLNDFRVDRHYLEAELAALKQAERIVTTHADVARHLRHLGLYNVEQLGWVVPDAVSCRKRPTNAKPVIGFPASALPRKGVFEIAQAAKSLGWAVLIGGSASYDPDLWNGIDVKHLPMRDDNWLDHVDLVALPAHVEHAPRMLLKALARGIPVVASSACGLPASSGHFDVTAGNIESLIDACRQALGSRKCDS